MASSQADGTGERARAVDALRERYDARAGPLLEEIDSGELTGALTTNAKALCGAHHRLLRVIAFVELLKPSVLCVEECDNFAYLVEKLGALGYACGDGDPSKA